MFAKLGHLYDALYTSLKDYGEEAKRLDYLLSQLEPKPSDLLDVGCGTGEHAMHLSKTYGYRVDGIDLDETLVAIASEKNPKSRFSAADMRNFSLGRRYDAVVCLFSSIAYVGDAYGLELALQCIGEHTKPGGWLILEPWAEPSEWDDGLVDAYESYDPQTQIRILQARKGRTSGSVSILEIDYHVESPLGNSDFSEEHRLALFNREETELALRMAGFEGRYVPAGILDRPLYLACYLP